MMTDDTVDIANTIRHVQVKVLTESLDRIQDEGPSEYSIHAPSRSAYRHNISQQRLNALAKVISRSGGQQVQS